MTLRWEEEQRAPEHRAVLGVSGPIDDVWHAHITVRWF
jgi:hypothetical protein